MQTRAGKGPWAINLHLPGGKESKTRGMGIETPPHSSRKGCDPRALPAAPRKKPCHARLFYIEAKACLTWTIYILAKAPEVSKHPPSITTCPAPAAGPTRWVPVLSAPCGPTPSFVASPRALKISQFRSRSILPDGTSTWLLVPPCPIASGIRRICHHGIDAESPGSHSPDELQQESACSPCHIIRKLRDLGL
jgi:hypothetical protein